jgi:transcriptional regulator with XRE-family HTH domain
MPQPVVLPDQVRAARALIGWNQGDLARAANISRETVADFESGKRVPIPNNLAAIMRAFSAARVVFIDETEDTGRGVRHSLPGGRDFDLEERLRIARALNKSIDESRRGGRDSEGR